MDKDLKIFALEYVQLHDDLLKEEKLAIGNFIMEASDKQVEFMLLTGKVKDKLTKEDINLINKNKSILELWVFSNDEIKAVLAAGAILGAGATVFATAISKLAHKAYKRFLSQAARKCKGKAGNEKTSCMKNAREEALRGKIKMYQQGISKCSKTKSPSDCKAKLVFKINKTKAQLGEL